MDLKKIPFTKPVHFESAEQYFLDVVKSGHTHGDGDMSKYCEKLLERKTGCRRALLTTSGTDALEMCAILADIGPGDEVIMPSFTFVSTATAVVAAGGTPVFVDVCLKSLCIDPEQVEKAITTKTKAIFPVHYAGFCFKMEMLLEIAARRSVLLIEDAAHCAGSFYKSKHLGTFGDLGILSFHQTKNISCGEGGALLVNNEALIDRAEVIREKGTNRRTFLRGEVAKYTWVDKGSSFLPNEFTAAVLRSQLENIDEINGKRLALFERYLSRTMVYWAASYSHRLSWKWS
ncbi:MAG: dTDP-4-amino-4,6-dideoxygalactose transaminase [Proteobacteria bacterium]|nr:dTDP-4-amino-4,6-dideoxygalactose transaminase [Pseudomonadota bacterium]